MGSRLFNSKFLSSKSVHGPPRVSLLIFNAVTIFVKLFSQNDPFLLLWHYLVLVRHFLSTIYTTWYVIFQFQFIAISKMLLSSASNNFLRKWLCLTGRFPMYSFSLFSGKFSPCACFFFWWSKLCLPFRHLVTQDLQWPLETRKHLITVS